MTTESALVNVYVGGPRGETCRLVHPAAATNPVPVMGIRFMLCFLSLLAYPFDDFDVVVEDGGDDGNHICLNNAGSDVLSASYTYVDHALESKIPLPHVHHILAATLLQDADQSFDTAIDSENVSDTCR